MMKSEPIVSLTLWLNFKGHLRNFNCILLTHLQIGDVLRHVDDGDLVEPHGEVRRQQLVDVLQPRDAATWGRFC